jgi:hypothetical protein
MIAACRQQMADQGRYKPLEASTFFPDHRLARPLPAGVVPRGFLDEDEHLYTGRINGSLPRRFHSQSPPLSWNGAAIDTISSARPVTIV